ncbi:hypothetical protein ACHAXA_008661 [Cyclostephanos tholiformis]|uniref:Methyltransferase domain-containing protein n=1 Tax=Cyclostephanos tholiformis TaxID=382380 RepID=A0ABD3R1W2_9STRA
MKSKSKSKSSSTTTTTAKPPDGGVIYSFPPLYDLAFGYRDYADEVDFLLRLHDEHSGTDAVAGVAGAAAGGEERRSSSSSTPLRLLELAAGPARHSLAALMGHPKARIDAITAMDISVDMVDYGTRNADVELGSHAGDDGGEYDGGGGSGRRDDFNYVRGDMRRVGDYANDGETFDGAWLLLGSMQHLLTNDDAIACLTSTHSVMKHGGTLIIELPHPRETFRMGECTTNGWTVPLVEGGTVDDDDDDDDGGDGDGEGEYGELRIVWGEEGDIFDPVTQIRQFSIGLELKVNDIDDIPKDDEDTSLLLSRMKADGRTNVREIVPLRLYTMQEIDALARVAGFELVAKYGALEEDVSIDDEDEAYRMVCVLRKK